MKEFERITYIETFRSFVKEDAANGGNKWHIHVDLRNGNFVFLKNSSKSKCLQEIGSFSTKKIKLTTREVNAVASEIRKLIKKYNDDAIICYSKACAKYGKKNVIESAFICETDNPHYKCAPPMKLYDKNVIIFYMLKEIETA